MKIVRYKTHYGSRYLNFDYVQSFKEKIESKEIVAVNEIGNEVVLFTAETESDLKSVMHSFVNWLGNPDDVIFNFEN